MAKGKKKEEKKWTGMPTGKDLEDIKVAVESTYDYLNQLNDAKEQIKDIFTEINAKTGIPRRVFNFLINNNFYANGYEVIKSNEELEDAYSAITKADLSTTDDE